MWIGTAEASQKVRLLSCKDSCVLEEFLLITLLRLGGGRYLCPVKWCGLHSSHSVHNCVC